MSLLKFSDEKRFTILTPIDYSENDIDNIMVGAIEGGINYWGYVKKMPEGKPPYAPKSQWCTRTLLDGGSITIGDTEMGGPEDEEETWTLDLVKLEKGIGKYNSLHSTNKDDYDAGSYDCIIQYALFDKLVFG